MQEGLFQQLMTRLFGKSWRTAATGYAGALFFILYPFLQEGSFNLHRDWPKVAGAAGCAVFGRVSKDAKATGLPEDKA